MAISFNQIGNGLLTPGVFVEFDTSKASQGPAIQEYVALLVGQRLAAGTKAAGTIDLITSASQARQYYGAGSMLAAMVEKFLSENNINELRVISLDDDGGGVAAEGTITLTGPATAAGTVGYIIAGRLYRVAVADTDTATDIGDALEAAITADADAQVTASNAAGVVTITYNHAGEVGNEIDIRQDPDTDLPSGVGSTIVAMGAATAGTTNPSLASVITAMGEEQYHVIGCPYTDATNLGLMQTELQDRWGPLRQNDGQYVSAKRDSVSNLSTFADTRNNEQETIIDCLGPSGPHEWAANLAAVIAREGQADPARPMQTVQLRYVGSPAKSELRTRGERDQLLGDGISTVIENAGQVFIERLRTLRKTNAFGAPDSSLADLNPKLTLSYIRFDFRVNFLLKFSRHKLADDGTRFGPGQVVLTPNTAKAELIARFRLWEELGLVEGASQFKRDLIVERNAQDPNRLDIQMPPDLINQLRVTAGQIAFLL